MHVLNQSVFLLYRGKKSFLYGDLRHGISAGLEKKKEDDFGKLY